MLALFELEPPPPHDKSVAIAAPHATKPSTSSSDFMTALLVLKVVTRERKGGADYSCGGSYFARHVHPFPAKSSAQVAFETT
jgi:hypothetical protein